METDISQGKTGAVADMELATVEQANCEAQPKSPMEAEVADAPWNCSTKELIFTKKTEAVSTSGSSMAGSQIETASCRTVEKDEGKPVGSFSSGGGKRGKGEERVGWENGCPTVQRNGDAHSNDGSEIVQEKTNGRSSEPDIETQGGEDMSETKSSRLKWTRPLREKFKLAVAELGGVMKATPKKILEVIDTPGLSLWQVKSFLQKYRKYQQISESCSRKEEVSEVAGGEGEGEKCGQSGRRKRRREEKGEVVEGKRGKEGEEVSPVSPNTPWETTLKVQMDVMREVQVLLQEQCAMQLEIEQQHATLVRMLKEARKVVPDSLSPSPSPSAAQPAVTGIVSSSARPVLPPPLAVPTVPSSLPPPSNASCQCAVQSACATCVLPSPTATSANMTSHTNNSKGLSSEALNGLISNQNSYTCPSPREGVCTTQHLQSLSPLTQSPPTPPPSLTTPHSSLGGSMVPNAGYFSSHDQSQSFQMPSYPPFFLQQSQQNQHYPNQNSNQHSQVQNHIQVSQNWQNQSPTYQVQPQIQNPFQQQIVRSQSPIQPQFQIHPQNQNQVQFQSQVHQRSDCQLQHFQHAHHNQHQIMSFSQLSPSQLSQSQLSHSQLPPLQVSSSLTSQLSPSQLPHLAPSMGAQTTMDMRQTHLYPQSNGLQPWNYDSSMATSPYFPHPNHCPSPSSVPSPNMESKMVNLSWQMSPTNSPNSANIISPFPPQSMSSEGQRSQSQAISSLGSHIIKEELQRGPEMDQDLESLFFQSNIENPIFTEQRTEGCVSMELDVMDGIPPAEAVWAKERELQECLTEGKREGEGVEKEVGGVVPPLLSLPSHVSIGGSNLNTHGTANGNRNGNGNSYGDRDSSVILSNGAVISPPPPLSLPHFPTFPMNERNSSPTPIRPGQESGVNIPPTPLAFQQMQLAALQQGRDFLNMVTGCPPGLQESLWEKMKQQAYLQLLQRQVNFEATGNGSNPISQMGLNGNVVQMTAKDVSTGMNSVFPSSPCAPQPPLTFVNNFASPSLPLQSVETYGFPQYLIAHSNSMTGTSGMGNTTTLPTTESGPILDPFVEFKKGNTGVHASGLSPSSSSGSANEAHETNGEAGNKQEGMYPMDALNCRRGGFGESGEMEVQNLGSLANALQKLTQQCQEILMPHCRVGVWEEKVPS